LEQLVGAERMQRYEQAILLLDPGDQALLFLRFELGCSHKQIAEHLGKPSADAARMGVTRAVERLLRELDRE
jgi:DNA-directed RNA polymerase specialized sigma24 family protein